MKKILLAVVLGCSLTSCLFAQYGGVVVQPIVGGNTIVGFASNAAAGGNIVTNGYRFSTGMWSLPTNTVTIINAFEYSQAGGVYSWATNYGVYTNSANTNMQFWKDVSFSGSWVIGTNKNDVNSTGNYYYYLGGNAFPTNDVGNWLVGDANGLIAAIALDIVSSVTASNLPQIVGTNGFISQITANPSTTLIAIGGSGSLFPLASAYTTNGTSVSLVTIRSEADASKSTIVGGLEMWTHGTNNPMINCLRVMGFMDAWTGDQRPAILKGMAAGKQTLGGAFILETMAAVGSPGTHGTFANSLYVATNGLMAVGNLTDSSDGNQNALKPPFWLTVYGDGSAWSGGSSAVASFGIMSKSLIATPVAAGEENDGTYRYWTDNTPTRHKYMVEGVNANGANITNATVSYPTNIINGVTNVNTLQHVVQWKINVAVSSPAATLGSAEIDGQLFINNTWFTVAELDIAGGATSILATNKGTLVIDVPQGVSMRLTNTISGTGYVAGLDNPANKTNTFTVFP